MKLLLAVALSNVVAGLLEANLLASSAVRLHVKGVEHALKPGAKSPLLRRAQARLS